MSKQQIIRKVLIAAIVASMAIVLTITGNASVLAQNPARPLITAENAGSVAQLGMLDAGAATLIRIVFSPDGKSVITGNESGVIQIWDLATGKSTDLKSPNATWVNSIVYSPDGKQFASTSKDTVVLWDAETKKQITTVKGKSYVFNLAYSPDGAMIAIGDDKAIRLLDTSTQKEVRLLTVPSSPQGLAFSPDGKTLAEIDGNTAGVNFFEVATGKSLKGIVAEKIYYDRLTYSHDGSLLATADGGKVTLWDVKTLKMKRTLEGQGDRIADLAFSGQNLVLVTAGADDAVRLWDAERGSGFSPLKGSFLLPNSVAFSPDGTLIASASSDGFIYFWGLPEGGQLDYPAPVKFTPKAGHWVGGGNSIDVSFDLTADGKISKFNWKWTIGTNYCSYIPENSFDIKDNGFQLDPGLLIRARFRSATVLFGTSPASGRCGNMVTFSTGGPRTWWVKLK